jgi:rare lipoprotein A
MARACALALVAFGLGACSSNPLAPKSQYSRRVVDEGEPVPKGGGSYKVGQPYQLKGKTYYPGEEARYRAEGIASWYGPDFHGRLTANGEVYDMHGISAAHPTLPMPSYLRVTNLDNGKSIIVRLNDRGPYAHDRLIDLSTGAAKALDFHRKGLARVRVEYVGRAPMEGSDDQMLLATLREGRPAPVPSSVVVASAKPFMPQFGGADSETGRSGTPLPAERPFTLGTRETARLAQAGPKARSVVQVTNPPEARAATAGYGAPSGPGLGLMSGRGLY